MRGIKNKLFRRIADVGVRESRIGMDKVQPVGIARALVGSKWSQTRPWWWWGNLQDNNNNISSPSTPISMIPGGDIALSKSDTMTSFWPDERKRFVKVYCKDQNCPEQHYVDRRQTIGLGPSVSVWATSALKGSSWGTALSNFCWTEVTCAKKPQPQWCRISCFHCRQEH
ncbi:hypothetical protein Btru_048554 [Bulinus truncatus]|nr:hypothetical protein Btru_048554 [Bulinus truncatus]